ncbi:dynamin family protein [Geitlerinema sp. P-1104]|uniref:dynamin family protein n=1 Tax=Geitlerinema sp. P-1104 TaxID=2546230 RepID=UPI001476B9C5|nr:dynamin family protein [Geitlerinema sp. P-1104]NMG59900.1 dynamin family protein [Geitlerinema sp. P-1104]
MNPTPPQCQNLDTQVQTLVQLQNAEATLPSQDTATIRTSLNKAISPRFEIVFAGAFSAGKSMLINALLERELLYSAQGHATGTECYIEYEPDPTQERVELTFLSQVEIRQQIGELSQLLAISEMGDLSDTQQLDKLSQMSQGIWEAEGGESRTERAKQAKLLEQLVLGWQANRDRIDTVNNATYSMAQLNANSLDEASQYARRSQNSSVLKKINYYCHHPLLEDGNVIIDTPGIDAPVKKDAKIAYDKIEHPDTSAVICVFKTAANGELTTEETQLLERIQKSPGIRDRVFYAFNYIDATWYDDQLRNRLEYQIKSQFRGGDRIYKTSALLGFYGSQIRQASPENHWGLDSIFANTPSTFDQQELTPKFVFEFNRYFSTPGRLSRTRFPSTPAISNADSEKEQYQQILNTYGQELIEQLVRDSGIQEFRREITRYLMEDRRPQLFEALANDLRPLCIELRNYYIHTWKELESQPQEIDTIKEQQVQQLNKELKQIGDDFKDHVTTYLNESIADKNNTSYERDFRQLQKQMLQKLDDLIEEFSVGETYKLAQKSHPEHAVVPMMAILVEAFYTLANQLKAVLVNASEELVANYFFQLRESIHNAEFYNKLYRFLGNDASIDQNLSRLEERVRDFVVGQAGYECDTYVRETPEFYGENTVPNFQLRQTLQQACRSQDYEGMVAAEPAIRQLLQVDFEKKVKNTVIRRFRTVLNSILNERLFQMANEQSQTILSQYELARTNLAKTLDREAEAKLERNRQYQAEVQENIEQYNEAIQGINGCLEEMSLGRVKLPPVQESDLQIFTPTTVISEDIAEVEGDLEVAPSEAERVTEETVVETPETTFPIPDEDVNFSSFGDG